MEAYGNSTVDILGKFFAFLRWKGKVYRQLFFVTTANASPNLLSRDGCYTLRSAEALLLHGIDKKFRRSQEIYKWHPHSLQPLLTDHRCMVWHVTVWQKMEMVRRNCLIPISILSARSNSKAYHWRSRTSFECTQMFLLELGSFQDLHTNSSSNQIWSQWDMHPDVFQFILQEAFHEEIWNLEWLGILEPVKEVT